MGKGTRLAGGAVRATWRWQRDGLRETRAPNAGRRGKQRARAAGQPVRRFRPAPEGQLASIRHMASRTRAAARVAGTGRRRAVRFGDAFATANAWREDGFRAYFGDRVW